jgi:hypothetical protein
MANKKSSDSQLAVKEVFFADGASSLFKDLNRLLCAVIGLLLVIMVTTRQVGANKAKEGYFYTPRPKAALTENAKFVQLFKEPLLIDGTCHNTSTHTQLFEIIMIHQNFVIEAFIFDTFSRILGISCSWVRREPHWENLHRLP